MSEAAMNGPSYNERDQREQDRGNEKNPISFLTDRLNPLKQKLSVNRLALQVGKQIVMMAARTPVGWIVGGILLLVILILFIFFSPSGGSLELGEEQPEELPSGGGNTTEPTVAGLTISKTGPAQIEFGENITYTISSTYNQDVGGIEPDKIVIVDKLPTNVEFVSATGTFTRSGNTIEWPFFTGSVTLTVRPTADNVDIINTVFGRSLVAQSRLLDSSAASLNAIFNDSAATSNVPVALLMAIAKVESQLMTYTSEEVVQFSSNLWWNGMPDDAPSVAQLPAPIRRGYAYNTCAFPKSNPICPGADVRGAMQFELGTWNSIKPLMSFSDGHDPDRRYVRDIIYAAGYFIRGKINQYDSRFNFTNNIANLTEAQVKALARSYCGGNPDANTNQAACGFGAHEANVWAYYQEYNSN